MNKLLDEEALKQWVVEKVGSGMAMPDVILHVCEMGQMNWAEAEQFVQTVQVYRSGSISKRRMTVIALLSITILIPGLIQLWQGLAYILSMLSPKMSDLQIAASAFGATAIFGQYLLPGIGMCIGGTWGLVWAYQQYQKSR